MNQILNLTITILLLVQLQTSAAQNMQIADTAFNTRVEFPELTRKKPKVLFDEAHNNFHKSAGLYRPFVELIRNDGCVISINNTPLDEKKLKDFNILIIANPLGAGETPSNPAFSDAECLAIKTWVKNGGSLLLIADHYPFGSAAKSLAAQFEVSMTEGGVFDSVYSVPSSKEFVMYMNFSRNNGLLDSTHAIMKGKGATNQIESVFTFFGQGLQGPPQATSLLPFSKFAQDFKASVKTEMTDKGKRTTTNYVDPVSAYGKSQGLAMNYGAGRVVVLGEASLLSAQIINKKKFGMNVPGSSNSQFALNIMRWLAHEL